MKSGWPMMLPPPCFTVKVTFTPASRLKLASVTMPTNGRGSAWPMAPIWPFPVSTTMRCAVVGVAECANTADPVKPVAAASTRLLPTPDRVPRRKFTDASPRLFVFTASDPRVAVPLTRPPLFSSTRNTTGTPITGCPSEFVSRTTRGWGRTRAHRAALGIP